MKKIYILKNKKTGYVSVKLDNDINECVYEIIKEYGYSSQRLEALREWKRSDGHIDDLGKVVEDTDQKVKRYNELHSRKTDSLTDFLNLQAERMKLIPNREESVFERKLKEAGITYEHQKPKTVIDVYGKEKGFIMDFFLPEYNCCIEIDGVSHDVHDTYKKDCQKSYYLFSEGIPCVRISVKLLKHINADNIRSIIENGIEQVKDYYKERRPDYNQIVDGLIQTFINRPQQAVRHACGFVKVDDDVLNIVISLEADPSSFGSPTVLQEKRAFYTSEPKQRSI